MLARSQSTRAAVRQNEMKVNITLVTTSTCPADGPCRFGRGAVIVPDEAVSGGFAGSGGSAISSLFRWTRAGSAIKLDDYNGLGVGPSSGQSPGRVNGRVSTRREP